MLACSLFPYTMLSPLQCHNLCQKQPIFFSGVISVTGLLHPHTCCTVIYTLHFWDTVVEVEESEVGTPQWSEANVPIPLDRGDTPFHDNTSDKTTKRAPIGH